ncbi:Copia protein, partial [Trachymyrmex cornetzi]
EAVLTAAQILNRVTTVKSRDKTPFELWHGKKPDISNIHVFGSICYSQVPKALRQKLDKKAVQRIFVAYKGESNNYKLFDPETRKFTHATNVKFDDEVRDFEFGTITVGENIDNRKDNYNEEADEDCEDKEDKKNEEYANKKEEDEIDER